MTSSTLDCTQPSIPEPVKRKLVTLPILRIGGRSIVAGIRSVYGSRTEGGALVEFAVTLPIVFLIMTGIFSFSTASFQKMELAQAVGTGGRVLAVSRQQTDPCQIAASAIYSAAPSLTQANIGLTFVLNGVSSGPSCPGPAGAANANLITGGNAQISATYPCKLAVYGKNFGSCTLATQITEVVQ